ncbi:MAG: LytTR family DNA-binding domain-containing protein [Bacteroidia bacterium]
MKNAIIIDDDILSANVLSDLLTPYSSNLKILEIFTSSAKALEFLSHHQVDVIFLDIEMPELNGFQLLEQLPLINFDIIFVTAYEQYALKAIKFSALDYLLKPLSVRELDRAMSKYFAHHKNPAEYLMMLESVFKNAKYSEQKIQKVALPASNGLELVDMKDIIRCTADRNYTEMFLSQAKKLIISKNLKEIEDMLDDRIFFRVHQSHLINLNFVKRYIKGEGGQVLMNDNSYVDVSRRKKEEFLSLITNRHKGEVIF